jgi:succinylarginine dihydrolase
MLSQGMQATSGVAGMMAAEGVYHNAVLCILNKCSLYCHHASSSAWWFETWLLFFHILRMLYNVIIPTDELHHFSEG